MIHLTMSLDPKAWPPISRPNIILRPDGGVLRSVQAPLIKKWDVMYRNGNAREYFANQGECWAHVLANGHINGYSGIMDCVARELMLEGIIFDLCDSGTLSDREGANGMIATVIRRKLSARGEYTSYGNFLCWMLLGWEHRNI